MDAAGARVARSAGATPNNEHVSTARPAVKPRTRASGCKLTNSGLTPRLISATAARPSMPASQAPSSAPPTATSRLSVRSWRITRPRDAPKAKRTLISRSRALARASSRLARLAQAISSTSPVAPSSSQSGVLYVVRSADTPLGAGTAPSRSAK